MAKPNSNSLYDFTDRYYEACNLRYSYSIPQLAKQVELAVEKCNAQAAVVKSTRGKNKKAWEKLMLESDEAHLMRYSEALIEARNSPIVDATKIIGNGFGKVSCISWPYLPAFKMSASDRFCREGEAGDKAAAWSIRANFNDEEIDDHIANLAYEMAGIEFDNQSNERWGGDDFHSYNESRVGLRRWRIAQNLKRLIDVRMDNYQHSPFNNIHCSLDRKTPPKNSCFMYDIDVKIDTLKVGDVIHVERNRTQSTIIRIMPKTMRVSEVDNKTRQTMERNVKKSVVVGSLIESANQPYDNAEIYHLIT